MSAPWLAKTPVHWKRHPLGHLVRTMGGGTPSKERPEFWAGRIPWVSPKDMKRPVLSDSEDHVSPLALEKTAIQLVPAPAVLVVVRGMILDHSFPVAETTVSVTLNQDMKALLPRGMIAARFLAYSLRGLEAALLSLVEEAGHGTKKLRTDLWRKFELAVPPLDEQRAIADFLDEKTATIDGVIAKKERLLGLLDEQRQALITRAVTQGLDPSVPMKDSGYEWMGRVPHHWQVERIKWVAKLESGHTPDKKVAAYWEKCSIPWVSLNDTKAILSNDYISDTSYHVNELGLANSSAHLLPARVVLFTRDATIGAAAITTRSMAVSQHIIAWVCGPRIVPEYLLRVFYSMRSELDRLSFGATIRTIGMGDVLTLTTPLPPVDEQRRIVAFVEESQRRSRGVDTALSAQLRSLREYRQALITAAVTGQLDVRSKQASRMEPAA